MGPTIHRLHTPRHQRGVSLTELLVGTALGLLVVAGTTTLAVGQVDQARRQTLAHRLQQDLRHAASLMERELRKAGHWGQALGGTAVDGATANPYAGVSLDAATATLTFALSREAQDNNIVDRADRSGFRLNRQDRSLQMLTGSGAWQTLTDPAVSRFGDDGLQIDSRLTRTLLEGACPKGCEGQGCPAVTAQEVTLTLRASAAADPALRRELRSHVVLRNDTVTGQCPAEEV